MRIRRRLAVSCLVLAIAACGQDGPPPPPPATNAPVGAVPQPVGAAIPQPVGQPVGVAIPQPVGVPGVGGSNFGTISLAPGFMPDPHTARGTSGGAIDASTLNATCRGWISQQPDHLFVAQAQFANLRVLVNGGTQDTTLVVQRPDGTYVCNDDTEGRDPVVAGGFPPGTYKLWVGSYSRGESIPYTLGVSELSSSMPSSLAGGMVAGAGASALDTTGGEANFGTVSLVPGFTPDPSIHNGTSGGAVAANGVNPACAGYVSARPDHLFNVGTPFANLRILVNSSADTTLVVRRPDGTFLCNDDTDGTNPAVAGAFPAGQYRIWVGSYQQGQNAPYKLGFTELASVTSAQLGL